MIRALELLGPELRPALEAASARAAGQPPMTRDEYRAALDAAGVETSACHPMFGYVYVRLPGGRRISVDLRPLASGGVDDARVWLEYLLERRRLAAAPAKSSAPGTDPR